MEKKCVTKAGIVLVFAICLCIAGQYENRVLTYANTLSDNGNATETISADPKENETTPKATQMKTEQTQITDLTDAFDVILNGVTNEFIAGYTIDRSFLMWLNAQYGDDTIIRLAYCVLDQEMDQEIWYDLTQNSIHVLWLSYCRDTGFQKYRLDHVYWKECADTEETVISFAGDFNFANDWCTTEYKRKQPGGIEDCFSKQLLEEMNASDILIMNNEFTYSSRGKALEGKDYTFRAEPDSVNWLLAFGTDLVTLANNHVYDYGAEGLLDTMSYLNRSGIAYVGAGKNIDEASKIVSFVANGRKIAFVSATEIERSTNYTKEATEAECGVLKTLNPDKFLKVIDRANQENDIVIAVVHWGTEGALKYDASQYRLAERFVAAGADAVIGGHPHRLQGAGYINGTPVVYSLGNFWFSTGTLYTTLAQITIAEDSSLRLKYLPCIQEGLTTGLIVDEKEKEEFYHYLAAYSVDIGMDEAGYVYDKTAEDYPAKKIAFDSDTSETKILGAMDNEGNVIDIVGNLK